MVDVADKTKGDTDGLTIDERTAIETICRDIGYKGITDFLEDRGCESLRDFVGDSKFKGVADYFFGEGWYSRVYRFKREGAQQTN